MALIKLGSMVTDARGSIAGVVYSRNRYGSYTRQRVKPVDPGSVEQNLWRGAVATLQARFRNTLTGAQRSGWERAAAQSSFVNKLGDKIDLAGAQAYIRVNAILSRFGKTIVDDAPPSPLTAEIVLPTFEEDSGSGDIEIDAISPALAVGAFLLVQWTADYPQTRNFFKGPYTARALLDSNDAYPYQLIAAASVQAGRRYFMRYSHIDVDGRLSASQRASVDSA